MRIVVALLLLLALPAPASAGPTTRLRDCATVVADRTGNGRCSGTGTFRVIVACEDGHFARSPWITIEERLGATGATCASRAIGAEIEEELPPA